LDPTITWLNLPVSSAPLVMLNLFQHPSKKDAALDKMGPETS
jgi:hypothetical protein